MSANLSSLGGVEWDELQAQMAEHATDRIREERFRERGEQGSRADRFEAYAAEGLPFDPEWMDLLRDAAQEIRVLEWENQRLRKGRA